MQKERIGFKVTLTIFGDRKVEDEQDKQKG